MLTTRDDRLKCKRCQFVNTVWQETILETNEEFKHLIRMDLNCRCSTRSEEISNDLFRVGFSFSRKFDGVPRAVFSVQKAGHAFNYIEIELLSPEKKLLMAFELKDTKTMYDDSLKWDTLLSFSFAIHGAKHKRGLVELGPKNSLQHDLRASKDFFDFEIRCQGQRIQAHRVVLAARSPVFGRMFQNEIWREGQTGTLKIEDFDPDVVKAMVDFLYEDQLEKGFDVKKVANLFQIAEKYQIQPLRIVCQEKMIQNLSNEALLKNVFNAKMSGADELFKYMAEKCNLNNYIVPGTLTITVD